MMNGERTSMDHHHCGQKRISWSAVLAGALVGIGLSFLFNLFSVSIGLSVVSTGKTGLIILGVGGFVGLLIGTIIAMFLSGLTAGYLGRNYSPKRNLGVVYGFASWALALIITILLSAHIGQFISSYSDFISNPSTIVVTQNNNHPAVDVKSSPQAPKSLIYVNPEKVANNLGLVAFVVFILFFIGAVSSCFGGHFGMKAKDNDDTWF